MAMSKTHVVVSSLLAAVATGSLFAQELRTVQLDISSQPLNKALNVWADQTGYQVMISEERMARGRTAPPLKGTYTPEGALRVLLASSDLKYRFVSPRTVAITHADTTAPTEDHSQHASGKLQAGGREPPLALAQSRPRETEAAAVSSTSDQVQGTGAARTQPVEEVIVTAQKRSERLQDVPVPVTALNGESLVTSNQLRIQDFADSVPGFTASPSPSAGGQQQLAVRGISTGFNTNPTVGITVDDVPYGASTNLVGNSVPDIDPNDLARIEVLRGPQGTLYGASSMGGLLKFVTVDPSTEGVSARLEGGLHSVRNGNDLGYNVRGSINLPLGENAAIRASAFTRRDAGYIDNPVRGIDGVNESRVNGGRVGLLWKLNDAVSLKLSALVQETKGDGASEVNLQPGLADLQQNYLPGIGAYNRKAQAYSATLNAGIGNADLALISGYNVTDFHDSFDFTYLLGGFFNSGIPVFTHNKAKKFTQEVRLTTPLGARIDWLVGAFYTDEDTPQVQDVRTLDPVTGVLGGSLLGLNVPTKYEEYAAFTDFTFKVTDRFDVQVGGRQSEIRHSLSETQTGPLAGAPIPKTTSDASAFTYLLTPRLRLSPDLMLYARFASGYRAGGPNGNPDPTVPRSYDPDKTQNYEFGLKGDFLDRLVTVDASLYYIDWKDLQLNLVSPNNAQTYTTNGSRAESKGVELSLTSRPISGLALGAWVTYGDAKLSEDVPAGSAIFGFDGDRLPYASRVSGKLSLDQDFPLANGLRATLGATVSYVGERFGTFIGAPLTPADRQRYPAYARTDLRAGMRFSNWNANLFVNNLTDRRGLVGGGEGTFPPFAFTYIQPRTVGLVVSTTFGTR
jgi:iron complex outermembrane receptor protein